MRIYIYIYAYMYIYIFVYPLFVRWFPPAPPCCDPKGAAGVLPPLGQPRRRQPYTPKHLPSIPLTINVHESVSYTCAFMQIYSYIYIYLFIYIYIYILIEMCIYIYAYTWVHSSLSCRESLSHPLLGIHRQERIVVHRCSSLEPRNLIPLSRQSAPFFHICSYVRALTHYYIYSNVPIHITLCTYTYIYIYKHTFTYIYLHFTFSVPLL